MLDPVTTTLLDIQTKLVSILHPKTILIGHSLNSDLTALKLTHPFIIDTALIYPHPRGPPLKSSLKWLAQKYLGREVQKGGAKGHDSIEDSRTCLDLVKQKCEKGPLWGTNDSAGENLFRRLARTGVRYKNQAGTAIAAGQTGGKSTAVVDWGDPKKGPGAPATVTIGCKSDEEVTRGVIRAVQGDSDGLEVPGGGVDFVWARMRELEALKGWWNNNKSLGVDSSTVVETVSTTDIATKTTISPSVIAAIGEEPDVKAEFDPVLDIVLSSTNKASQPTSQEERSEIPAATTTKPLTAIERTTSTLTQQIHTIYSSLPPCTALMVYSGSGDPREMSRLQAMQATFKREYKIKKWDELSVKWTDVEEQALKRAARQARNGIGFITVK
jgi:RNA exonuclease 1